MNVRQIKWGQVLLWILATFGVMTLLAFLVLSLAYKVFYQNTREQQIASPSGEMTAYREVTRGGLGTVWTTRIYVTDRSESRSIMIYSNKDSDFIPELQWVSAEQLSISLPCGRVDHVSNPEAFGRGKDAFERLQVRFANTSDKCVNRKEE